MNSNNAPARPQILVIDDEIEILDVIRQILLDEGFTVHTAHTPHDGLELYERLWREIDLVLLDYLMPEMTGDVVFESMQRINPDAKVVLLTGCDDNVAKRMFEKGLHGYLQKPFYLDDLIKRVREEIEAV